MGRQGCVFRVDAIYPHSSPGARPPLLSRQPPSLSSEGGCYILTWCFCICIVATLASAAMALLAFLVSCLVKKNPQDTEEDPKSFKTFMTKSKGAKKRKMSDADREDEEDVQRQIMIRKSLASRASSRTTTRVSQGKAPQEEDEKDDSEEDSEEDRPTNKHNQDSLKTDWKAYEADLQRNRSVLIRRHPGVDRSGGSSSKAPLSPITATSPTSPTSHMSPPFTTSPRPNPAPRQHTFPSIARKPVPRTATTIPEYPASPGGE